MWVWRQHERQQSNHEERRQRDRTAGCPARYGVRPVCRSRPQCCVLPLSCGERPSVFPQPQRGAQPGVQPEPKLRGDQQPPGVHRPERGNERGGERADEDDRRPELQRLPHVEHGTEPGGKRYQHRAGQPRDEPPHEPVPCAHEPQPADQPPDGGLYFGKITHTIIGAHGASVSGSNAGGRDG